MAGDPDKRERKTKEKKLKDEITVLNKEIRDRDNQIDRK